MLQSIDKKFILYLLVLLILVTSKSFAINISTLNTKAGVISLMYHRFNETKYPSTNIQLEIFKEQLKIIEDEGIKFIHPKEFEQSLVEKKKERKILFTVDDGLLSFYKNAWPILKKKKIPFILFVSTREVGAFNYMTWDQIREISKENFVEIGNHSHTHEYLVEEKSELIKIDIEKSISIFKRELGRNSDFFSYPFGEYSINFKEIIKSLNFKYAFGQHSGVMDETKDFYEFPRFPINEKYGEIKRFKSLMKTLPFKYKKVLPEEKYLLQSQNPPDVKIEFYDGIKNLKSLNCFSNEADKWRQSEINFLNETTLQININEKFVGERGRINCSLRDPSGFWRWLGIQFVLSDK